MYDSGRRSLWKDTPGRAENQRLDMKLSGPSDVSYNEVWYGKFDEYNSNLQELHTVMSDHSLERYDYVEESFVDNSEAFSDIFPPGFKTELGGFYVNTGKLNLVPICPPKEIKKANQKKINPPDSKDVLKKPIKDSEALKYTMKKPKRDLSDPKKIMKKPKMGSSKLKNMIKNPAISSRQKTMMKDLKKLKLESFLSKNLGQNIPHKETDEKKIAGTSALNRLSADTKIVKM